jgi:hypothetical protein
MSNLSVGMIKLSGRMIDGDSVSCTGAQLIEILRVLQDNRNDYKWLAGDTTANSNVLNETMPSKPILIDSTQNLISILTNVDQFLSGVFLAIPSSVSSVSINRIFDTEDDPTLDLEDGILEIRAFDTTYFEIYSSQLDILQRLSEYFHVAIESLGNYGMSNNTN